MSKVIYPGSFDPITKGHMDIVSQATYLFDEVIIAVMQNSNKKEGFFSIEERVQIIREIYRDFNSVKVITGSEATVDLARLHGCKAIIRGLRSLSDFDMEIQLSQINLEISNNSIRTICLFADKNFQFVSSSMVRELFALHKSITNYVEPLVAEKMGEKRKKLCQN